MTVKTRSGSKMARAVSEGKILGGDGNLYNDPITAFNNSDDTMYIGPGTFDTGGQTLNINTEGFVLRGVGNQSVINGGAATAVEASATEVEIHNIRFQSDTGTAGTTHGLNVTGKLFVGTNLHIYQCDNAAIDLASNGFKLSNLVIDGRTGQRGGNGINGNGILVSSGGVDGVLDTLQIDGVGGLGLSNISLDQLVVNGISARTCTSDGVAVLANDCVISDAILTGNGGDGYRDGGIDNRANGRSGGNTGTNVNTANATGAVTNFTTGALN